MEAVKRFDLRPHLAVLALLLAACAATKPDWVAPIRPGSSVSKASFYGVAYPEGHFGDAGGLMRNGKLVVPPDYRNIYPVDAQDRLLVGRRIDNQRLDLLHPEEERVIHTNFDVMSWNFGSHGLTLLAMRDGTVSGRKDVVVIDAAGNEFCTLYATPGKTRIHCHGSILAIDSVDENGEAYSSIHDAYGLPISPKLTSLVHTQYVTAGRYHGPGQARYRLPKRVFPGDWNNVFAPGEVTSCIVVGTLPAHDDRSFLDRRLLRPIAEDGSLAPLPAGSVGWFPVHLDGTLYSTPGKGYHHSTYSLHTHWAIVYPHGEDYRFAVGKGDFASIASRAELGELPMYDRLVFLDGAESSASDFGTNYMEGGKPGCYAVRFAATGNWVRIDAETWTPTANGDNGGAGFLSLEEARLGETKEQTAAREARLLAERLAAAREAEKQRLEQLERRRAFDAYVDGLVAKLTDDSPQSEWRNLARMSGRAALWDRYLSREPAPSAVDIEWAQQAGANASIVYQAQMLRDRNQEQILRDRRIAEVNAREEASARRRQLEDELRAMPSSNASAWSGSSSDSAPGTYFLDRIGYGAMVEQNTRAWANGANPWGHSWGPR